MAEATYKTCLICKQSLPHSDFNLSRSRPDGRYPYCRACDNAKRKAARDNRADLKETKRLYDAARYKERREKVIERQAAIYATRKDTIKERVREWQARNPELVRSYKATSKARRRAQTESGVSGQALLEWKRSQPKVCHWCGSRCSKRYHVDHYVPLARGGTHTLDNLRITCPSCNLEKHAKDPLDFARSIGRLF